MGFVIGVLTLILVLDCLALILLVLIQLPKKEAGAGLAFGGAATDALFGAGSGNVLTKVTKYAATVFFILSIILAIMQSHYHNRGSRFLQTLSSPPKPAAGSVAPATTPSPPPATTATPAPSTGTNMMLLAPTAESTNPAAAPSTAAPTAPSTNPPATQK